MNSNKKVIKRIIGIAFLILSAITVFYQWQFSKLKTDAKELVVVATKKINVGEELNGDNTSLELREITSINEETLTDLVLVQGSVATETINEKEIVADNRIVSKEEYKKLNERLVAITASDNTSDPFVGYSLKPTDKVDILYYDSVGVYEGKPFLEGQTIFDLKSSEGVSYANKLEGYVPKYALFWVDKKIAEEISSRQEEGGYFKLIVHRDKDLVKEN